MTDQYAKKTLKGTMHASSQDPYVKKNLLPGDGAQAAKAGDD